MIVITVGKSYIDIDGYASSIAYRELLNMQGIETKFVSNAVLNYSITDSLRKLSYKIDDYTINEDDKFIILDLSNKDYFPEFVKEDNIIEIIDHHPGFEEYWNNRLKDKSIIEEIGSVATIIVEKYNQLGLLNKMDKSIAKLLMAAILDNTLNFTANITTDRDKEAYNLLKNITEDYTEEYFSECSSYIVDNLNESIKNDIKIQHINNLLPDIFGQLTIWDINKLSFEDIKSIMNSYGNKWIINLISLKDNASYILCSNNEVQDNINKVLNGNKIDNMVILKPAKLRKEIIKSFIKGE